jgi:hypothetical protein
LRPGTRAPGIDVSLLVSWTAGVSAHLSQAGAACIDAAATGRMAVGLQAVGRRLRGSVLAVGSWRTRCPGPEFAAGAPLLSASVPMVALGRRRFTIGLRSGGRFNDDGYVLTPYGHLSVVLRRGGITQQVMSQPVG